MACLTGSLFSFYKIKINEHGLAYGSFHENKLVLEVGGRCYLLFAAVEPEETPFTLLHFFSRPLHSILSFSSNPLTCFMLPLTIIQPSSNEDEAAFMFAMQLARVSALPMALKAAIELDLLEIIAKAGPGAQLSTTQIASQLPTQNPAAPALLDRMLRLLASYSILSCSVVDRNDGHVERLYGLEPVCEFLVKNQDDVSIAPLVLMNQDKVLMESWYVSSFTRSNMSGVCIRKRNPCLVERERNHAFQPLPRNSIPLY